MKELSNLKKVIYNIDMVNGFVREGALADETIALALPEQLRLIKKFLKEEQGLAFIKDSHLKGCAEFNTFPEHCLIGDKESELIEELLPYEDKALVYLKNSTSAMFAPNMMDDLLKMKDLVEIVGVGCLTHICVPNFLIPLKCFLNQYDRDVKVFAVKDAIGNINSKEKQYQDDAAYYLMESNGIIVVKDLEELEEKEKTLGLTIKVEKRI